MSAPRWRVIADGLRQRIHGGEWAPGQALPARRELMEHYAVTSSGTMTRALQALVAEGVLLSDPAAPRLGVRVRSQRRVQRDLIRGLKEEYAQGLADDAANPGLGLFERATDVAPEAVQVVVTYAHDVAAEPDVADMLGVAPDEPLLVRTFAYFIEGTPHQLVTSYLSAAVAARAGLIDESSERPNRGTIAQLRDAGVHVERVSISLEARLPTSAEAAALTIPATISVYVHRRRMLTAAGDTVELSRAVVPTDRVSYLIDVPLTTSPAIPAPEDLS